VLAPVFKLWFYSSAPFVGVVGLDASARPRPLRSAGVAVATAVGRPSAPVHIGKIALLNSPDDIGEERSALIFTPRPGSRHGERSLCRGGHPAQIAFVLLRSVVEDLRARGVRPYHVGRVHQIPLVRVGLAGEEHFAVAGHDPAAELAIGGTVDLELDHSCWFSSSCMPGGAHQRRVIRGRRAGFSQPDLIIVISLMSKLGPYWIRRPIRRYGAIDRALPAIAS
jgi:hypothetical protein